MSNALSTPLRENERIKLIDSIRGLALLGILLMNIMAQSQSFVFYDKMDPRQSMTGLNFFAWGGEMMFFEGTMRGLFSILFGAGTVLLLTRLIKSKSGLEPADIFYRRLLWLLVFGLLNAFVFLWPGDILYPYALCGLLLFPFRNLSPKNLLWIAFAILAIGTYRQNSDLYHDKGVIAKGETIAVLDAKKQPLTDQQKEDLAAYKTLKEKSSAAGILKEAQKDEQKVKGQSYLSIFRYYRDINMTLQGDDFYRGGIWDILLFFFIGMALYKSGFLVGKKSNTLYALIAVVGIGVGLWLNYVNKQLIYNLKFDMFEVRKQMSLRTYEIRRVFQTIGYLSLLILTYKAVPFRKIMHLFAPVGQMAFTNYLTQSIYTSIIFYGFGLFATLQRYEAYYIVAAIWLFQIVTSHLWLRYFKFGPFEWVWRSLTYLKKQPMRRVSSTAATEGEMVLEPTPAPVLA
ncbi:MAG: DUF418 domain-containing protein [Flavisolibacter sp.]